MNLGLVFVFNIIRIFTLTANSKNVIDLTLIQ